MDEFLFELRELCLMSHYPQTNGKRADVYERREEILSDKLIAIELRLYPSLKRHPSHQMILRLILRIVSPLHKIRVFAFKADLTMSAYSRK